VTDIPKKKLGKRKWGKTSKTCKLTHPDNSSKNTTYSKVTWGLTSFTQTLQICFIHTPSAELVRTAK
jgi:hypothetical protein